MTRGGRAIAFVNDRAGGDDLYVIRASGRGLRRVTAGGGSDRNPAWYPHGRLLLFDRNRRGDRDISRVRIGGGAVRRLTSHPAEVILPMFRGQG